MHLLPPPSCGQRGTQFQVNVLSRNQQNRDRGRITNTYATRHAGAHPKDQAPIPQKWLRVKAMGIPTILPTAHVTNTNPDCAQRERISRVDRICIASKREDTIQKQTHADSLQTSHPAAENVKLTTAPRKAIHMGIIKKVSDNTMSNHLEDLCPCEQTALLLTTIRDASDRICSAVNDATILLIKRLSRFCLFRIARATLWRSA